MRAGLGAVIALPFAPIFTVGFLSVIPTLPESHFLAPLAGVVRDWQLLSMFVVIMFLGAAISLLLAFDRTKRKYIPVPLGYLAVFMLPWPVEGPPEQWRQTGLHRAAEKGMVIVDALEQYKRQNGNYPKELDALVPAFLPEIPHTGMVGYPNYRYHLAWEGFDGYRLFVRVMPLPLAFDSLFYMPPSPRNDHYTGLSNIEPIGQWWYFYD